MQNNRLTLPQGVLPLSQIAGHPALQLPALVQLYEHCISMVFHIRGDAARIQLEDELLECGIAPQAVACAQIVQSKVANKIAHDVTDADLRSAVRTFKHAIVALAQERLEQQQRSLVLGNKPGVIEQENSDHGPGRVQRKPFQELPPDTESIAAKGARYGCGCLTVIMVPVPFIWFFEALTGMSLMTNSDEPPSAGDFGSVLEASFVVLIFLSIGHYAYKRIFAKHYSASVLRVCIYLSCAFWILGLVVELIDQA